MKSTKPYLIRAIHEWCADQGYTSYMAVKVDETTRVPREFVKDGEIVLNIAAEATHQLLIGNEEITFQARFGGRPFPVVVPVERVAAIYASENGEGMAFEVTERSLTDATADGETAMQEIGGVADDVPASKPERVATRPVLTLIK